MNQAFNPNSFNSISLYQPQNLFDPNKFNSLNFGTNINGAGLENNTNFLGAFDGSSVQQDDGIFGKLGMNIPTLELGLKGLNSLSNLYGALEASKLAREQMNSAREFADINLANQIKSYNTALADRARSRAVAEGQPQSVADAYVEANRMTR